MLAGLIQASYGNVTLLEIAWTLSGVVGLVISLWNVQDARADGEAIAPSVLNGAAREVAKSNVREEGIRCAKCFVVILAGIAAMLAAPSNSADPVGLPQYITAAAVFGLMILVVTNTVVARHSRLKIRNATRQHSAIRT